MKRGCGTQWVSLALALLLIFPFAAGCRGVGGNQSHSEMSFEFFDTVSEILSYQGDSKEEFEERTEAAFGLLRNYHRLFDIYHGYDGVNNLKTVNDHAGKSPVKVERELFDFLLYAKEMHAFTKGTVNVMYGAVLRLWHQCREEAREGTSSRIPAAAELAEAATHTGIENLVLDEAACTVFLKDAASSLDVGALGKGYATEAAAQLLKEKGATSYVLNIGGNVRTVGEKRNGEGWVVGITNPDTQSEEPFALRVKLKDTSCVTSGSYERYHTVDGVDYHHIIDVTTHMPARYFVSVSIITESGSLADALSTALFCMTYEEGLSLLGGRKDVAVLWILPTGEKKMTPNFSTILVD